MRATLAFLATGAALFASTACAPTVSTSTDSFGANASIFGSNAVPKPSFTFPAHRSSGPKPPGWLRPGYAKQSLIYVAAGSEVVIFPERGLNPAPIGAITDGVSGAYGLFVDGRRDLYVANQDGWVSAYRPGSLHPWIVYADTNWPLYVVTDHEGRVYVANRNGTVSEFPPRQTTPDRTLKLPGVEADGINLDDASNLYVAYRGRSGNGSIEVFPPGSTNGHILGMHLKQPQGLQLDRSRNIIVVESGTFNVDIFRPGRIRPSQIVPTGCCPTQVVLRDAQDNMYFSDYANGNVYISHYPPGEFQPKIEAGLTNVQGMALSNEER